MTDHERLCEFIASITDEARPGSTLEAECRQWDTRLRSNGPDGLRVVPFTLVRELGKIGNDVADLYQNRNRPDEDLIIGFDNSGLTLGTVRLCRAMLHAAGGEDALEDVP